MIPIRFQPELEIMWLVEMAGDEIMYLLVEMAGDEIMYLLVEMELDIMT